VLDLPEGPDVASSSGDPGVLVVSAAPGILPYFDDPCVPDVPIDLEFAGAPDVPGILEAFGDLGVLGALGVREVLGESAYFEVPEVLEVPGLPDESGVFACLAYPELIGDPEDLDVLENFASSGKPGDLDVSGVPDVLCGPVSKDTQAEAGKVGSKPVGQAFLLSRILNLVRGWRS